MMNVFRAVIFACVVGMVHGQVYTTRDALKSDIDNCFDGTGHWEQHTAPCKTISDWNVSQVTDMTFLFQSKNTFDQNINNWDVSSVTRMYGMFNGASAFNQPLNSWDVSSVTSMEHMFDGASAFDQSLSCWNVHEKTLITDMLLNSPAANQPHYFGRVGVTYSDGYVKISGTPGDNCFADTDQVCNPGYAVSNNTCTPCELNFVQPRKLRRTGPDVECTAFTPTNGQLQTAVQRCLDDAGNWLTTDDHCLNINNWDVSKVTNMGYMFDGASTFDQPLNDWDVSSVTDMVGMFNGASAFNQPLNNWDVSKVTNMRQMFREASAFNQPLTNWDVSSVTNMIVMFAGTNTQKIVFNQPLDNWDVSNVEYMDDMFTASQFNHTLSCWDFYTSVSGDGILAYGLTYSPPAAQLTHYVDKADLDMTRLNIKYYGDRDSAVSDCACPPGSYINNSTCNPCETGTVSTMGNSPSCAACPAGSVPSADQKRCIVCASGHTSTANSCEACAAGTYAFDRGSPSCTDCPAGFAQSEAGQDSCEACPVGNNAPEGSSSCLTCEPGTYALATSAACTDCPSGFAQSEASQSSCEPCSTNKASFAGSTQCYNASEMFTHTSQLDSVTRQMFIDEYEKRFNKCS